MMARHWTAETAEEAESYFASLSTSDLNQRLELAHAQAILASERKQTDALEDLQEMERAILREILTR